MEKNHQTAEPPVDRTPAKNRRRYGYEFYRDNFRRMTVVAMGLLCLDLVIVLAMVAVFRAQPEQELYATTRNGLLVRLHQFDSVPEIKAFQKAKVARQNTQTP